ncbi:MAG: D-2-hydroxyacid dehydrogenase [Lachnospiraceae bacterium]|nr:D-2-hydroxyacid dehydrogenase [Candidatus Minthocola equi]
MKVVIMDTGSIDHGDLSWEAFDRFGEVKMFSDVAGEQEAIRRIGDAEILVNNKTAITEKVLDACKNLKMITELATGYDNVAVEYAASLGIPVYNVPEYATGSVAQYTIALLLELSHHIGMHDTSVKAGDWSKSKDFCYWLTPQVELAGKTLGIIGYGKIGKKVAEIAHSLDMRVIAYSPHYEDGVSLDEIYAESDIISLNCRATKENREFICSESIARMKDGVWIINTARGALINEQDMADALASGKVGAFAADVASHEPINPDNPLLTAPNCIITPHIAWTATACRQRALETTIENIEGFLSGQEQNRVN